MNGDPLLLSLMLLAPGKQLPAQILLGAQDRVVQMGEVRETPAGSRTLGVSSYLFAPRKKALASAGRAPVAVGHRTGRERGQPMQRRWCILSGALLAACGRGDDGGSVARLQYEPGALEGQVLWRMRRASASVPLGRELEADSVWSNVLGYTFIAHRPEGDEAGIRSVRAVSDGVPLHSDPRGIHRTGSGRYCLDVGYRIVDVFDEWNHHLGSAVVDSATGPRRLLQHLGITRGHSDAVDRLSLNARGIQHWRALLPLILEGGGSVYLRRRKPEPLEALADPADSIAVVLVRYQVEELEGFTLVGRDGDGERFRHVFTTGGHYVVTAIVYVPDAPTGRQLLTHLGLTAP